MSAALEMNCEETNRIQPGLECVLQYNGQKRDCVAINEDQKRDCVLLLTCESVTMLLGQSKN